MTVPIYQVDAFTNRPYAGNPAAVCLLDDPGAGDPGWMQHLAAEMNLSETAFLVPTDDGWDLRWFTPTVEVDLCGHATLASAHVLWEVGRAVIDETIRFRTRSGLLKAGRDGDWIELDFPAYRSEPVTPPADVIEGLGAEPVAVFLARNGHNHIVELASEKAVRSLKPDFERFRRLKTGVIATARSDDLRYDFVSRYFASAFGIDEDPVTGSAHCALGPYWQNRLGKDEFLAHQVSKRGGVVRVRLVGERAHLGGQAVTVLRGELSEPALHQSQPAVAAS